MSDQKVKKSNRAGSFFTIIKMFAFISIIAVSVYSGMYIMEVSYSKNADGEQQLGLINNRLNHLNGQLDHLHGKLEIVALNQVQNNKERDLIQKDLEVKSFQLVSSKKVIDNQQKQIDTLNAAINAVPWYRAAYYSTGNGIKSAWNGTKNGISTSYQYWKLLRTSPDEDEVSN